MGQNPPSAQALPYIGQICYFSFEKPPIGWLVCDGSSLPCGDYAALYSLIGVTFGSIGEGFFSLPDLRGRIPVGPNSPYSNTIITSYGLQLGGSVLTIPAGPTVTVGAAAPGGSTVAVQSATEQLLPLLPPTLGLTAMICAGGTYPAFP